MIKSVLEEMSLIKHLYNLEYKELCIEDAFDNIEIDVLSYMSTLGETTQRYTHEYGCIFLCKSANIEVNVSIDDKRNLHYSVARYGVPEGD